MRPRSNTRRWCGALALAGALFGCASAAELSALAEHQIKALYLFNFTKYVEWPAASSNAAPILNVSDSGVDMTLPEGLFSGAPVSLFSAEAVGVEILSRPCIDWFHRSRVPRTILCSSVPLNLGLSFR